MTLNPSCALIISTYNNPKALAKILDSLVVGTQQPDEVLIADDGSSELTKSVIENHLLNKQVGLKHVWHEDRGFRKSKILNQGIKKSSADYIVFLDGDCIPEKRFITDHLTFAEKGFFIQGRRAFIDRSSVHSFIDNKNSLMRLFFTGKIHGGFKAIRWPIPYIAIDKGHRGLIGCNLSIWRNDLLLVNGFDEEYEGWGGEDSDLCVRLYNNRIRRKMIYGRSRVYHLNHEEEDKSQAQERFKRLDKTIKEKKRVCIRGLTNKGPENSYHADK